MTPPAHVGKGRVSVVSLKNVPQIADGPAMSTARSRRPVFILVESRNDLRAYDMLGRTVALDEVEALCPGVTTRFR